MKSTPKTVWQKLSNQPKWRYVIAWILFTTIGWGTRQYIIDSWYTEFFALGQLGFAIDMLFFLVFIGLTQSIILKLYLKKFAIIPWLLVCACWCTFTNQSDLSPYSYTMISITAYTSYILYCVISVLAFMRYALHWERWSVAVFPVLIILVGNTLINSILSGLFPDIMDIMALIGLWENWSSTHPLKFYADGLNLGLATSLVFLVKPKVSVEKPLSKPQVA